MTEAYKADRTISTLFSEQRQVDDVIRRLWGEISSRKPEFRVSSPRKM